MNIKFQMSKYKIFLIAVIVSAMGLAVCSCSEGDEGEGMSRSGTELHNVELAVAACMAAPANPVRNLEADPRIAGFIIISAIKYDA